MPSPDFLEYADHPTPLGPINRARTLHTKRIKIKQQDIVNMETEIV